MSKVKILHIDIETAPITAFTWSLFKPILQIDNIVHDWYMLCWAGKWHGEDNISVDALWLHDKTYKKDKRNDKRIVDSVWHMLDEADIVVGHNAKRFDVAKINAKFYQYGYTPPSPYKVVDTYQVIRSKFKLTSNKLDYAARLRSFGQKFETNYQLWLDVMAGDKKQCERMLDYNVQDVVLLEEVYTDLLPWITNHPNVSLYNEGTEGCACTKCGSENLRKDGTVKLTAGVYQQFKCKDCGGWARSGTNLSPLERRKKTLRNVV